MKKIMFVLAVAAIACSPAFMSQAQAAQGKAHKAGHCKAVHHAARGAHHHAKHHKTA